MSSKKEWRHIRIEYMDGTTDEIWREEFEKIRKLLPILDGLNEAKNLKDRLENVLK